MSNVAPPAWLSTRFLLSIAVVSLALASPVPAGADARQPRPREQELIAAEVNRQAISMAALEERCRNSYTTLEVQLLAARHGQLRLLINDLLLRQEADRRGISREALLERVKDLGSIAVSPEEIQAFRDEHGDRFAGEGEATTRLVEAAVRESKAEERVLTFVNQLAEAARMTIYLPKRPQVVRPIRPGSLDEAPPAPVAGPAGPPGVVAEVNGATIPTTALDARFSDLSRRTEELRHKIRTLTLAKMVDETLASQEAARRGITVEALFEAETRASEIAVSDELVEKAYRRMRSTGFDSSADEAAAKRQVAARIREAQAKPKWGAFLKTLRNKATIAVHLKDPDGKPVDLDTH